jgi:hypothetical protein
MLTSSGAGIAQSAQRLTMGWTAERLEFETLTGRDFSQHHVFQISSGAHPATYPTGTGDSFRGGKAAGT